MPREPLKPMVILGRKIKATEGPIGQESPARAAQAEGCVYIHRRLLCPAWPGARRWEHLDVAPWPSHEVGD